MALRRTPPKYPSNPDLSRKRKQSLDMDLDSWLLEHKADKRVEELIANSVKNVLTSELTSITDSLKSISEAVMVNTKNNTSISNLLTDIKSRLSDIEKSLNYTDEQLTCFDQRLKAMEERCAQDENLSATIAVLENKIDVMEQSARACNVELANLPDKRGENLISITMNLGSLIKCEFSQRDITSVHRVPHADSKVTRPKNVIIKFTNRYLRDNFLAAFRKMKSIDSSQLSISGSPTKIYANEHLTLKNKKLFRECRIKAKASVYKYVWVKNGTILVRRSDNSPIIAVRNMADIGKII